MPGNIPSRMLPPGGNILHEHGLVFNLAQIAPGIKPLVAGALAPFMTACIAGVLV